MSEFNFGDLIEKEEPEPEQPIEIEQPTKTENESLTNQTTIIVEEKETMLKTEEKSLKIEDLEGIIEETITKYLSMKGDKQPIKDKLKLYYKAVNYGHKYYEKYGFKNNHEFLTEIDKVIDEL